MASDDPKVWAKSLKCAGKSIELNLDMDQPFSFTSKMDSGIDVQCQCCFTFPRLWKHTEEWRLETLIDDEEWESPPLVMLPRDESEGVDSGGVTHIGLNDKTTYLLSNTDVDKATYTATAANIILEDLVDLGEREDGYSISLVNPPTRIVPTYDAHEGKRMEHICRIAADSGMGFYIGTSGQIIFIDMDGYTDTLSDTDWIHTGSWKNDPTNEITSQKIIKTSKIQTEYEFVWAEKGAQTETIQAPGLTSDIDVHDESNIGYIAAASCYDNADPNQGGLVKFIALNPDDFEEGQIPTPTSSGPVLSIIFDIRDPKQEELIGTIDARVTVQGVPWDAVEGEEVTFETEESCLVGVTYTEIPVAVSYTAEEDGPALETELRKFTIDGYDWYYYKGYFYRDLDEFELSFDCYEILSYTEGSSAEISFTDEERPADGYVDGVTFLNESDADDVKKKQLYHNVKGCRTLDYSAQYPIFTMAPGNLIPAWRRYPQAVIGSISVDNTSTKVEAFQKVWW